MNTLGISVGDHVRTSYDTGPYVVKSIWGPVWWWSNPQMLTVWPYPVISLVCRNIIVEPHTRPSNSYLNHIHQDNDQWFTDGGNEIFVKKMNVVHIAQLDMFAVDPFPERRKAYVFDADVDYSDRFKVFHCPKCYLDFNGEKFNHGHACPWCPRCKGYAQSVDIIMMKRTEKNDQG